MPSPFPGMDPYLESPVSWPGVHHELIAVVRELLARQLVPRYFVDVETRVYVLDEDDEAIRHFAPDVSVREGTRPGQSRGGKRTKVEPVVLLTVIEPIEIRESRLVVKTTGGNRAVVTAIEVLSPANKTRGSRGRELFLTKRREVFESSLNLVEIDLLRGGTRAPSTLPWPRGDYLVHVSRAKKRPQGEAYVWSVRDRLPEVPVPLRNGEPDATLDLEEAVKTAYQRAHYEAEIDYKVPPVPPLAGPDAVWAAKLVARRH